MKEILSLRRMTSADVPVVSSIHHSSWNPSEISVKLGPRFIELLYSAISNCHDAFTYLVERDGKIIAYSSGFERYRSFNHRLLKSNLIVLTRIALYRLWTGQLTFIDLFNALTDSRKLRRLRFPDIHWGLAALNNQYKGTPLGRDAFALATKAVFSDLRRAGHLGCWGPCDHRNIAMIKWLERLGFEKVDTIHFIGREVLIFEKVFVQ